ncbi:conserved hypothetical protein [Neospora caninum Liverpool]|uniref:Uncharacterized protein n=1 Tax=Neospora caninum (strain Liverpool) TaxID=572307 RepID=F0VD35_NEOCL|nr:conserved hypothetical protein [Neospora caninum Liverpool]CBZ51550.1 conserved hypothetical protein [Neospora caninum Liverpool]CEL65501.1 TPA: hypothetical protein BN1204_013430 [Neospora caninum Liverpool]|eukprot:XP_003881583.1 conserved hypothetical protein [Neospora caninum Liverpool]
MRSSIPARRRAFTVAEARAADQRSETKLNALETTVKAFQSFATLGQQKAEWISFAGSLQIQRQQAEAALRRCQELVDDVECRISRRPSVRAEYEKAKTAARPTASPSDRRGDPNCQMPCRCGTPAKVDEDAGGSAGAADAEIWSAEVLLENAVLLARLGRRIASQFTRDVSGESTSGVRSALGSSVTGHQVTDNKAARLPPGQAPRDRKKGIPQVKNDEPVDLSLRSTCCSSSETSLFDSRLHSGSFRSESDPHLQESPALGTLAASVDLRTPSLRLQILGFTELLEQYGLMVVAIEQQLEREYIRAQRAAQRSRACLRRVESPKGTSMLRGNTRCSVRSSKAKDASACPEPGELTEEEDHFVETCYAVSPNTCYHTASLLSKVCTEYQQKLQRLEEDFQRDQLSMKQELAALSGRKKDVLCALKGLRCARRLTNGEGKNRRAWHVSADASATSICSPYPAEVPGSRRKARDSVDGAAPVDDIAEREVSPRHEEVSEFPPVPASDRIELQAASQCSACLPEPTESRLQEVADTVNFICGQFSYPGASRSLLLERLQLEFPSASAHDLREVTEIQRQIALLHQRRTGHWKAFSSARIAALAEAQKRRSNIVLRCGQAKAKKAERRRQAEKRAELHERLGRQRAAFQEKERARKEVEDEARARAEETQSRLEAKEQQRREEVKQTVLTYQRHKEEVLKIERAAAEAKAHDEAVQYAATCRRNARRIARRREIDAWRDHQRDERRRERLRRQQEIVQRIRRAAERLAVVAQSDPKRLLSDTGASRARAEAIKKEHEGERSESTRIKSFGVRHGYGTDTLLRDMRLKLSVALFEAGLHRSEAGHEALLSVGEK